MSGLLDEIDEPQDREITLGTSALLAIFFGVVLICAVFFGLGYSLGRRSGDTTTAALPTARQSASSKSTPSDSTSNLADESAADKSRATPVPAKAVAQAVARTTPVSVAADGADVVPPAKLAPAKQPASANATAGSASTPGGQTMVQLMAAAQPEDAEVLAAALRKRGYHAIVRDEADHLYHVQVGPFGNRAEADTMRRKLQADGYNAILK